MYLGKQKVLQNNPDKYDCRQENIFDGVSLPIKLTVLFTCEHVFGKVQRKMMRLSVYLGFRYALQNLLNQVNNNSVNGMLVIEIIPRTKIHVSCKFQKMVIKYKHTDCG
jgi:hypothetical protein